MSNRQKRMWPLWSGISMFVLMGLFPPMDRYSTGFGSQSRAFGFFFSADSTDIAFGKLFIMWFIVAIIIVGLIVTFRGKEK